MRRKYKAGVLLLITLSLTGAVFFIASDSTELSASNSTAAVPARQPNLTSEVPAPQAATGKSATGKTIFSNTLALNEPLPEEDQESGMNPIERIRAIQNKTELHQALLEDHQQFTRYSAYNQRFDSEDADPVLARYAIDERSTENPEDNTSLTIWSDKKYYLKGDQVNIYASLRDQEGNPLKTQFMAQVIYNEQQNLQNIALQDANQDGIHEYSLPLNADTNPAWKAGVYKVLIVNNTNKVTDALTFIISQPDIELIGQFKDSVSTRGELIIEAEVLVASENRYYLQASLYSANQIAIGATQQSLQLTPGKHWLKLAFDGSLIRDSGESAPFLLKHISLAKVTLPIQRAPVIDADYFTRDYPIERFHPSAQSQDATLLAN
jgi:hypothetical protein